MPKKQTGFGPQDFSNFGELFHYLRERAHLSQRELAVLAGYHFSYISYLEKNTRMVDEAALLGRFVPALGIAEEPAWINRLLELAKHNRKHEAPAASQSVSVENADSLPASFTSMIGREYESARLRKLLLDPEIRLVTIAGPPGVGKTCLALNIARKISPAFQHGAFFVDLTPVRNLDLLIPSIALALGLPESSKTTIADDLNAMLKQKNTLIVLDNFEQIIEAAPRLLPLLSAAPGLKILVTSRETLRLRGEQEFHLEPLPTPAEYKTNSIDQLQNFPAINLFVERAQAVKPEFKLDEKNASLVAEICHRLDGLPLAMELAAARIRTLSLPSMLEQLDNRLAWMVNGPRDLPAWRQTLQGLIEWSYNLLSEKEKIFFCRLSIFSGGWTLEAAEEVCSDESLCLRADVFNLLIQLSDKSLVMPNAEDDRYRFLETLREFAFEKLKSSGELARLRERHANFYLGFAQQAKPHIQQGREQLLWLKRMEFDYDNIRLALAWSVEDPVRVETAMQLGMAVHIFWLTRSYFSEARRWLGQILSLDAAPNAHRANLLRFASDYASSQGDYVRAREYEAEAMKISEILKDEDGIYLSLDGMAMLAGMQGDYAQAADLFEQVLVYRRQIADVKLLVATLNNLAIAVRRLGNLDRARAIYAEVIALTKETGNIRSLSYALSGLSEVHVELKEYKTARMLQRESIVIRHQLGDVRGVSISLNSIAISLAYLGHQTLALTLGSAAAKIRAELGVTISKAGLADHEAFFAELRARLGDELFEQTWARGQSLLLDQAVTLALEEGG